MNSKPKSIARKRNLCRRVNGLRLIGRLNGSFVRHDDLILLIQRAQTSESDWIKLKSISNVIPSHVFGFDFSWVEVRRSLI